MLNWWGKLLYYVSSSFIRLIARLVFRVRVEGAANVPRDGAILIVCNHVSHLDPPIVGAFAPRLIFNMAKKELFKIKILHWFMSSIGTIMVDRGRGTLAVDEAVSRLKQGGAIVIFPEGTRSVDGRLKKGRSGGAVIAIRSDCTIVPAAIIGSELAMTKGSKQIKPVKVNVKFGEPYKIGYSGDILKIPREVLEFERFDMLERIEKLLPDHMKPEMSDKQQWYGDLLNQDQSIDSTNATTQLVTDQSQG